MKLWKDMLGNRNFKMRFTPLVLIQNENAGWLAKIYVWTCNIVVNWHESVAPNSLSIHANLCDINY